MGTNNGRVVFFDVGGTLMYSNPSVPEKFCEIASKFGHRVEYDKAQSMMDEVDMYYLEQYELDGDFWCDNERAIQIWKDMYVLMARGCGISDCLEELAQAMYDEYLKPECWSLYDDVPECLETLKCNGYKLGVISNWDASLESVLRGLGCIEYFDVVLASAVEKCRKPYPEIFQRALDRMGVDADHAIHVGDYPEADGAAAGAGITPVIIDRYGWQKDCGLIRIESLDDLAACIESLYEHVL